MEMVTVSTPAGLFSVSHLPPVTLRFTLPPDYPSESPPDYQLECRWMTEMQESVRERWTKRNSRRKPNKGVVQVVKINYPLKISKNSVLQTAKLRAKLDAAWLDCIGCPVIYTWRQLLQDEALSAAVEDGKLDLSELHEKAVKERKAVIEATNKSTRVKQECSAAPVESRLIDDDDGDEENPYNGHRPLRMSSEGAQRQVN